MADFNNIRLEQDKRGVATLTLNRPDKHHAFNAEMIAEMTEAAELRKSDEAVRVVVLAAEGPSFCGLNEC
jgi:methylglutaconyl-CoA hydratase